MKNLTLVIPAKYESESLPIFLKEISMYDCQKLIVMQTGDEKTYESIKDLKGYEILFQKNNGYGNALIEGVEATKTEFFCIINADGSMNPAYLESMLSECNGRDFVFTSRYSRDGGSDDDDFVTFIGNKFFSLFGNIFFKLNISDILFTYILGKTESFKSLNLKFSDFRICVEIPINAKKKKMSYTSISSYERSRIAGKKKVNALKDGFLILCAMIVLFFRKKIWKKKL